MRAPPGGERRVLVADYRFLAGDTTPLGRLTDAGFAVIRNPYGRRLSTEELLALGGECVGVIAGSEQYTDPVLARLPKMRCISRVGVGTDNIDLDAARRRGIMVCTAPDAPTHAVAEFTVGLMLALLQGIAQMDRAVRLRRWEPCLGRQLDALRVGLVGLGRIGRAVAERLGAWRCELYGCDIAPVEPWVQGAGVTLLSLEELLQTADLVSLHVPHTPAMHHLINARTVGLMKPGALLVNTSRGGLIDEGALYAALAPGRLGGRGARRLCGRTLSGAARLARPGTADRSRRIPHGRSAPAHGAGSGGEPTCRPGSRTRRTSSVKPIEIWRVAQVGEQ